MWCRQATLESYHVPSLSRDPDALQNVIILDFSMVYMPQSSTFWYTIHSKNYLSKKQNLAFLKLSGFFQNNTLYGHILRPDWDFVLPFLVDVQEMWHCQTQTCQHHLTLLVFFYVPSNVRFLVLWLSYQTSSGGVFLTGAFTSLASCPCSNGIFFLYSFSMLYFFSPSPFDLSFWKRSPWRRKYH